MFTGIVAACGEISGIVQKERDWRLTVMAGALDMADVALGDSIAVDGVCLTVVAYDSRSFAVDVSAESLGLTTLCEFKVGRRVNLEKALTPTTRLGGHLVSGHVDGVGVVQSRELVGESLRFGIRVPDGLAKYVAVKGSICVDGVSLTVNEVTGAEFAVNIIPHTASATTLDEYLPGRRVNIEVDIIARYLQRLLLGERAASAERGIDLDFLRSHGFLSGLGRE